MSAYVALPETCAVVIKALVRVSVNGGDIWGLVASFAKYGLYTNVTGFKLPLTDSRYSATWLLVLSIATSNDCAPVSDDLGSLKSNANG